MKWWLLLKTIYSQSRFPYNFLFLLWRYCSEICVWSTPVLKENSRSSGRMTGFKWKHSKALNVAEDSNQYQPAAHLTIPPLWSTPLSWEGQLHTALPSSSSEDLSLFFRNRKEELSLENINPSLPLSKVWEEGVKIKKKPRLEIRTVSREVNI